MNLLDMVKDQVSGSLISSASNFLGEDSSGVGKALDGIFPSLMGKMIDTAEDSNGLTKLFDMASNADAGILDDIGGLFGGGAGNVAKLMNNGSGVLNLLLGNSSGNLIDQIAGYSGLKGSAASSLIKMAAPFLMSLVGKYIKNKALDAAGLSSWLGGQKNQVKASMPGNLLNTLGASFLGKGADVVTGLASEGMDAGKQVIEDAGDVVKDAAGLVGDVAEGAVDAGKKVVTGAVDVAGDVGEAAVKTGSSLLKWLIPLFLIAIVGSYFGFRTGCSAVDSAVDVTKDAGSAVVEKTADVAGEAADLAGDAAGAVAGAIGSAFSKIDEAAKAALDGITFAANSAGDQMMKFIDGGFAGDGRFRFNNLTFATGSASITGETAVEVDNIAAILKAYPGVKVMVEGHTDNTGDEAKNVQLSQARANAVKARLMGKGIEGGRIMTKGFGSAQPTATNDTEEGRAQNRRIEIAISQ